MWGVQILLKTFHHTHDRLLTRHTIQATITKNFQFRFTIVFSFYAEQFQTRDTDTMSTISDVSTVPTVLEGRISYGMNLDPSMSLLRQPTFQAGQSLQWLGY